MVVTKNGDNRVRFAKAPVDATVCQHVLVSRIKAVAFSSLTVRTQLILSNYSGQHLAAARLIDGFAACDL